MQPWLLPPICYFLDTLLFKSFLQAKLWGTPVIDEDSFFHLVKQSTSQVSFSQQYSRSSGYDNSRLEVRTSDEIKGAYIVCFSQRTIHC